MPSPTLSLLICHLRQRSAYLRRLLQSLEHQCQAFPDQVEICVEKDSGELSVGEKRNRLLDRALGMFTAFIDDDDLVAGNYVRRILTAIDRQPEVDCVGIEGIVTVGGPRKLQPRRFIHSIRFDRWFEQGGVYYRPPNHLNPIAARHSKSVSFPRKDIGEDHDWSMVIRPRLQTEVMLEGPLYFYESR